MPLISSIFFPHVLDNNQCMQDPSVCDANADCVDTDGTATCTCKNGYTGDGQTCNGNYSHLYSTANYFKKTAHN